MLGRARGLPEGLHDLVNALKQAYTLEISHARCKPVFNHQFALSRLKAQGYRLAVCSNSVRQSVETMMRLSALEPYLDHIVSNQDVSRGKPDPEMYLAAMATLGVEAHECLILEDNDHGIQAAIASGGHLMRIGVPDDVTHAAIMEAVGRIEADGSSRPSSPPSSRPSSGEAR